MEKGTPIIMNAWVSLLKTNSIRQFFNLCRFNSQFKQTNEKDIGLNPTAKIFSDTEIVFDSKLLYK